MSLIKKTKIIYFLFYFIRTKLYWYHLRTSLILNSHFQALNNKSTLVYIFNFSFYHTLIYVDSAQLSWYLIICFNRCALNQNTSYLLRISPMSNPTMNYTFTKHFSIFYLLSFHSAKRPCETWQSFKHLASSNSYL